MRSTTLYSALTTMPMIAGTENWRRSVDVFSVPKGFSRSIIASPEFLAQLY